jgi:hypothetical protein
MVSSAGTVCLNCHHILPKCQPTQLSPSIGIFDPALPQQLDVKAVIILGASYIW